MYYLYNMRKKMKTGSVNKKVNKKSQKVSVLSFNYKLSCKILLAFSFYLKKK